MAALVVVALAPGITARMTVSAGIAVAPAQGVERVTLLRAADEALYQAKEAGRNRVAGLGEPGPQDREHTPLADADQAVAPSSDTVAAPTERSRARTATRH